MSDATPAPDVPAAPAPDDSTAAQPVADGAAPDAAAAGSDAAATSASSSAPTPAPSVTDDPGDGPVPNVQNSADSDTPNATAALITDPAPLPADTALAQVIGTPGPLGLAGANTPDTGGINADLINHENPFQAPSPTVTPAAGLPTTDKTSPDYFRSDQVSTSTDASAGPNTDLVTPTGIFGPIGDQSQSDSTTVDQIDASDEPATSANPVSDGIAAAATIQPIGGQVIPATVVPATPEGADIAQADTTTTPGVTPAPDASITPAAPAPASAPTDSTSETDNTGGQSDVDPNAEALPGQTTPEDEPAADASDSTPSSSTSSDTSSAPSESAPASTEPASSSSEAASSDSSAPVQTSTDAAPAAPAPAAPEPTSAPAEQPAPAPAPTPAPAPAAQPAADEPEREPLIPQVGYETPSANPNHDQVDHTVKPNVNARKEDWYDYAQTQGYTGNFDDVTKAWFIENYG